MSRGNVKKAANGWPLEREKLFEIFHTGVDAMGCIIYPFDPLVVERTAEQTILAPSSWLFSRALDGEQLRNEFSCTTVGLRAFP